MSESTQCISCKHYKLFGRCDAFEEIPEEIITGEFNHSQKWPGQENDILYEAEDS